MATIQERLRSGAKPAQMRERGWPDRDEVSWRDLTEAAAHIDALEKRVKELEGALEDAQDDLMTIADLDPSAMHSVTTDTNLALLRACEIAIRRSGTIDGVLLNGGAKP